MTAKEKKRTGLKTRHSIRRDAGLRGDSRRARTHRGGARRYSPPQKAAAT